MARVTAAALNSIDWPMYSASATRHLAWIHETLEISLPVRPGSITQICHRMTTVLQGSGSKESQEWELPAPSCL